VTDIQKFFDHQISLLTLAGPKEHITSDETVPNTAQWNNYTGS